MAIPQSRADFAAFCLRALGDGAITVNVTADQIDDRIDQALVMWRDYHHLGTYRLFVPYTLTETDIANKWIPGPTNVIEVIRVLPYANEFSSALFSALHYAKYVFYMNYNFGVGFGQVAGYDIALSNLEMLDEQLGQKIGFRFNRYDLQLWLDTDWTLFNAGQYVCYECYAVEEADALWGDIWLQRYATALIKQNWGNNLGKYSNVQLLNGITYNGQQIAEDAARDIERLEHMLIHNYSQPIIGLLA
jgi:hypothetical protein